MSVFTFDNYKAFMSAMVKNNKAQRGYQTCLAQAAGCQRAFISQVLRGKAQLTPDHAAALSVYWHLSSLETDYFLELVSLGRAGTLLLQKMSRRRLANIKGQHSELSMKVLNAETLTAEEQTTYYSSWFWSAIHVLTSIPGFQKPDAISKRLKLPIHLVERTLQNLVQLRILNKSENSTWKPAQNNLFLPNKSHMTYMNHANWRQQALQDVQVQESDSVHYTTLHALSKSDALRFRTLLMDFLQTTKTMVATSPEEELICFTCDLFRVGT